MSNKITAIQQINDAIDKVEKNLMEVDKVLIGISSNMQKVNTDFKGMKYPQDINTKIAEAKQLATDLNAVQKQQAKLQQDLVKQYAKRKTVMSDTNLALQKERFETNELNKRQREAAKLSSTLATEYQKQSIKLNQLVRRQKDLALKQELGIKLNKQEERQLRRLTRAIDKKRHALEKVDRGVGRYHRNIGNYRDAMKGAAGAARSMASALGLIGGAVLFVRVMQDAVKVARDFEKQNATLSGILQVEKEDMKALTDEAIRLGSETVKTAGEVTQLQIAYARLGFSQQEIINLTEATISGSIAMNAELDRTANLVGAVVNTFDDLSTTDAPKIIDILSLSTAKSALNFEKLEKGIPIVAGAANAAGIPFTKLVALMGKLSDSGIDVSSSSTALRNIFIESAAQGLNYSQIIEKIKASQDKLTAANDQFGKRAAVSATVLAKNIEATEDLDEALQNAAGTAESMAQKELDTLDGSLQLLRSAWEGYILATDEANGTTNKLKEVIDFLAQNLATILNTVIDVAKGFLAYKVAMVLLNNATKAGLALQSAYRISLLAMNKGLISTIRNMKFLRLALLKTGIGAAAVAIGAIVVALVKWRDELKRVNRANEQAKQRMDEMTKSIRDERFEMNKLANTILQTNDNQEERNKLINELFTKYPQFNKYIGEEEVNNKNLKKALEKVNEEYLKRLALKRLEAKLDIEGKQQKVADEMTDAADAGGEYEQVLFDIQGQLTAVGVNTEKVTGSLENRATVLKKLISQEQARITTARANNEATKAEIANLPILDGFIEAINQRRGESIRANSELSEANNILNEAQAEVQKTRERLNMLTEDGNEAMDNEVVITVKNTKATKELGEAKKTVLKGSIAYYEAVIKQLRDQQSRLADTNAKWKEYEEKIKAAQLAIQALKGELETDEKVNYDEKFQADFEKKVNDLAFGFFSYRMQKEKELKQKTEEEKTEIAKKHAELRAQLEQDLANGIIDLTNNLFEAKIQRYDDEINRINDRYAVILDNEELTEQQRSAIEAERDRKERQLEKKKRAEQRKQAIFNKAINVAEIAINTATAISEANPNVFLMALAAAVGVAQTAAALAVPIPRYEKGKGAYDLYEGWAIWGEKRQEAKIGADGSIELSPARAGNHLTHVKKDDVIHPNAKQLFKSIQENSFNNYLQRSSANIDSIIAARLIVKSNQQENAKLLNAISKIKNKTTLHQNIDFGDEARFLAHIKDTL